MESIRLVRPSRCPEMPGNLHDERILAAQLPGHDLFRDHRRHLLAEHEHFRLPWAGDGPERLPGLLRRCAPPFPGTPTKRNPMTISSRPDEMECQVPPHAERIISATMNPQRQIPSASPTNGQGAARQVGVLAHGRHGRGADLADGDSAAQRGQPDRQRRRDVLDHRSPAPRPPRRTACANSTGAAADQHQPQGHEGSLLHFKPPDERRMNGENCSPVSLKNLEKNS